MKIIKICDKEYEIDCNALTYIQFKKIFGVGLFKDIQTLKTFVVSEKIPIIAISSLSADGRLKGSTNIKYTADFVFKLFKTIRKYGGAATAITQDINDFFFLNI